MRMATELERRRAAGELLAAEAHALRAYGWVPYVVEGQKGVIYWTRPQRNPPECLTQSQAVAQLHQEENF